MISDFVSIAEELDKALKPIDELWKKLDDAEYKKLLEEIRSKVLDALGTAEDNCDLGYEED